MQQGNRINDHPFTSLYKHKIKNCLVERMNLRIDSTEKKMKAVSVNEETRTVKKKKMLKDALLCNEE